MRHCCCVFSLFHLFHVVFFYNSIYISNWFRSFRVSLSLSLFRLLNYSDTLIAVVQLTIFFSFHYFISFIRSFVRLLNFSFDLATYIQCRVYLRVLLKFNGNFIYLFNFLAFATSWYTTVFHHFCFQLSQLCMLQISLPTAFNSPHLAYFVFFRCVQ